MKPESLVARRAVDCAARAPCEPGYSDVRDGDHAQENRNTRRGHCPAGWGRIRPRGGLGQSGLAGHSGQFRHHVRKHRFGHDLRRAGMGGSDVVPDPAVPGRRHAGDPGQHARRAARCRNERREPRRPSSAWDTHRRGCSTTQPARTGPSSSTGATAMGRLGSRSPRTRPSSARRTARCRCRPSDGTPTSATSSRSSTRAMAGRCPIMLQVWNEPNLSSGLSVKTRVPGSSRSLKDAVASLYELERITRVAVDSSREPRHQPDLDRAAPSTQRLRQAVPGQAGSQALSSSPWRSTSTGTRPGRPTRWSSSGTNGSRACVRG